MKKLFCLLLCVALLFCFTGCDEANTSSGNVGSQVQKPTENVKHKDNISLLFCSSDTLNPYTAQTEINRQLCRLVFDPLVKTDNEFNPVLCLAKGVTIKDKECRVAIKSVKFSDGSAVTAQDVVYSFSAAKASETAYAYKLYNIESATATSGSEVLFTMKKSDPYCKNVLDFPIIKAESDKRTDSDGVILPTIGCGRYVPKSDYSVLVLNEKYYGKKGAIKSIALQVAPDKESISHYIEIGAADMYYTDISDGNIIRMSADKYSINLNNLVYIGINSSYGMLKEESVRHAISSAIDRSAVCSSSYYNNAVAATGFFNPVWSETASVQNIQTTANKKITVENLAEIGYNNLDSDGYYVNSSGNALNLTLLVNKENSIRVGAAHRIASQISNAGIKVTVVERKYSEYVSLLKSGNFQLYLGEVNITPNMDLTSLVSPNSSAVYGIPFVEEETTEETQTDEQSEDNSQTTEKYVKTNKSLEIIKGFYDGKNSVNDVATTLQTEMLLIPICYRTGVLFCDENIKNVKNASQSDIYFSIESYLVEEKR